MSQYTDDDWDRSAQPVTREDDTTNRGEPAMRTVNVSEDDLEMVISGGAKDQAELDDCLLRLAQSFENQTSRKPGQPW